MLTEREGETCIYRPRSGERGGNGNQAEGESTSKIMGGQAALLSQKVSYDVDFAGSLILVVHCTSCMEFG